MKNLKYAVYKGSWDKMPDFSKLTPVDTGVVKNNKISLDVTKLKDAFGLVFEADFTISNTDEYKFTLGSDDGSILAIDGEGLVDNDGVHGNQAKSGAEELQAGEHTLKVLFFEKGGGEELGLRVESKSIGKVVLSKKDPAKGGAVSRDPILIQPEIPGEAIVHRSFIDKARPRAIAIGYPGNVHVCWDADTLNLSFLWRGDFIDTAGHWNGRGSKSATVGKDYVQPSPGMSMQILESMSEPWVDYSQAKIKYQKDNPNPTNEITFDLKHPDYQFRGYRLDKKRFPTFKYDFQKLRVSEFYKPQMVDGVMSIVRSIDISGTPVSNAYIRLARANSLEESGGWYDIGNGMKIKVNGVKPVLRDAGGKQELLAPVQANSQVHVDYRWNEGFSL